MARTFTERTHFLTSDDPSGDFTLGDYRRWLRECDSMGMPDSALCLNRCGEVSVTWVSDRATTAPVSLLPRQEPAEAPV